MDYTQLDPSKLKKLTNARSLCNTSKRTPSRIKRIQALQYADTFCDFPRFLDLPPEQRTAIYEDLLILDNSWTCYPEILVTCKAINKEASAILYGHNVLEVQIYPNVIRVHGEPCEEGVD